MWASCATTAKPCGSTALPTCSICSSSIRRPSTRLWRRPAIEASCGGRSSAWDARITDATGLPRRSSGRREPDLAAAGEGIFRSQCAGCHEYGDDRRTPTGLIRLRGMRPQDVGTDAAAALRISCPVPDTGALVIPPKSYTAADAELLKDCAGVKAGTAFAGSSFARTVQAAVDGIKQKAYASAGID